MKKIILILCLVLGFAVPASANGLVNPPFQLVLFSQTQSVTANSTTETDLTGTGTGSLTLPANFFTPGKVLEIWGIGLHTASGNPTITMRLYLGSALILTTGAVASATSTNATWDVRIFLTGLTTGTSGTIQAQGFYIETAGGGNLFSMPNTSPVTINTTAAQTIRLTAQWSTATGDSLTMTNFVVRKDN